MQPQKVSKTQFKAQLLKHLRQVEKTKTPLVVTHTGKPVIKVVPYTPEPLKSLQELRGTVISYDKPTQPVGQKDWETLR